MRRTFAALSIGGLAGAIVGAAEAPDTSARAALTSAGVPVTSADETFHATHGPDALADETGSVPRPINLCKQLSDGAAHAPDGAAHACASVPESYILR